MQYDSLLVEVRDITLGRVGRIPADDLVFNGTIALNGVGTWKVTLPADHPMVPHLRRKGSGIIVTNTATGETVLSGPMTTPTEAESVDDASGTVEFEGITDDILLSDRVAYVTPSQPISNQGTAVSRTYEGSAEAVMHEIVDDNLGPGALPERQHPGFIMGPNLDRGSIISKAVRYDTLADALAAVGGPDGIAFRVIQRGSVLAFETYQANDRGGEIRLSVATNTLASGSVAETPASVTRAIVAGPAGSVIGAREVVSDASQDAEELWGRRIERFVDGSSSSTTSQLQAAGNEVLATEGMSGLAADIQPTMDSSMQFGEDWDLGDVIQIEVGTRAIAASIVSATFSVSAAGMATQVSVGDARTVAAKAAAGNGPLSKAKAEISRFPNTPSLSAVANQAQQAGVIAGDAKATADAALEAAENAQGLDGYPPSASPDPIVTEGVGTLVINWDAIDNPDLVSYDIHVEVNDGTPNFTPSSGNFVTSQLGTSVAIQTLKDGTRLQPGTEYVVKIVARDGDGSANPSNYALGTPLYYVSDGQVPEFSPNVTVSGGIRSLYVKWSAITGGDPILAYDVYMQVDDGLEFIPTPETLVDSINGLSTTIKTLPGDDEVELDPNTSYAIRVVARDQDGPGPASVQVVGTPVQITGDDIAVNAVTADNILGNTITADKFAAELALASTIQAGATDLGGVDPSAYGPNIMPGFDGLVQSWNYTGISNEPPAGSWRFVPLGAQGSDWAFPDTFTANPGDPVWDTGWGATGAPALRFQQAAASNMIFGWTGMDVEPDTYYQLSVGIASPGYTVPTSDFGAAVRIMIGEDMGFFGGQEEWVRLISHMVQKPDGDLATAARIIKTGPTQSRLYVYLRIHTTAIDMQRSDALYLVAPSLNKLTEASPWLVEAPSADTSFSVGDAPDPPLSLDAIRFDPESGDSSSATLSHYTRQPTYSGNYWNGFPSGFIGHPGEDGQLTHEYAAEFTTTSTGTAHTGSWHYVPPANPAWALGGPVSLRFNTSGTVTGDHLTAIGVNLSCYDASGSQLSSVGTSLAPPTVEDPTQWSINFSTPAGTASMVFRVTFNTRSDIPAGTAMKFALGGVHAANAQALNPNYGRVSARHVELDQDGIRLTDERGALQVDIPTSGTKTATFRGDVESRNLRATGGATLEGESIISRSGTMTLAKGTGTPTQTPDLVETYEEIQFENKINWGSVTSVTRDHGGGYIVSENYNGGTRYSWWSTTGKLRGEPTTQGTAAVVDSVVMQQFAGSGEIMYAGYLSSANRYEVGWWTSDKSSFYRANFSPTAGAGRATFGWNPSNNNLYITENLSDGRLRIRRVVLSTNSDSTVTSTTFTGSAGTSTSRNVNLVYGTTFDWDDTSTNRWITAPRGGGAVRVVSNNSTSGSMIASERWDIRSDAVGFGWNGTQFYSMSSTGVLTLYSSDHWNPATKRYWHAGITLADSNAGGAGTAETDLGPLARLERKPRTSGVRITLPALAKPALGDDDAPNRTRLYMAEGTEPLTEANRTSLWRQAEFGATGAQVVTSRTKPYLITTGSNPPATNTFPASGAARWKSEATDGNGNPYAEVRGSGEWRMGTISGTPEGPLNQSFVPMLDMQKNGSSYSLADRTESLITGWDVLTNVGMGSISGSSVEIVHPGIYMVSFTATKPDTSGTGGSGEHRFVVDIRKTAANGPILVRGGEYTGDKAAAIQASLPVYLNAGDRICGTVFSDDVSGTSGLTLGGTAYLHHFTVVKIA